MRSPWWFRIGLAVPLLIASELFSFGGLWLLHGRPVLWGDLQAARAKSGAAPARVGEGQEGGAAPGFMAEHALHPYLGFVVDPTRSGGDVSPFGFYDTDLPVQKRDEQRMIIGVVGGSFAAMFANHGMPRVVERLREQPGMAAREIVVLNLGLGGYKQPQQLMTLSYLLALGAEFDAVINIDGFNEVALHAVENQPKQVFPAFPRAWYFRVASSPDRGTLELLGHRAITEDRLRRDARRFSRRPWRWSLSASLVWTVRQRRLASEWHRLTEELTTHAVQRTASYATTGPGTGALTESIDDQLASLWEEGSVQLARLCEANGIAYLHYLQPNQYVAGSKPMGAEERRMAYVENHPYRAGVERGYPRLIARGADLRQRGVRFFDLTQAFADRAEPLYIDACCHVGPEGYRILAGGIADDLIEALASHR